MSNALFLKYSILCILITAFVFPAFAFADELISTTTVTDQQILPTQGMIDETAVEFNRDYFKGYIVDFTNIVTAPVRWDPSDWITAGIISGISAGLYDNDAKIQKWVQDHKTTTTGTIGDTVTYFGHGKFTPMILGGMYLYGYVEDDGKMRETVLLSIESFVLTGVFVQTIKHTTHRHRPNTGDPPHSFDGPSLNGTSSNSSFPSGHASSAFAVATVIASEYDNIIVPPLAYSIAAITAFNRVSHNAHWSSDAFIGAAIGFFTGKVIVASHQNSKTDNLSFTPIIIDGLPGMALTYKF